MTDYQWYPGHMTKALRMMKENIGLVDLVIELADARIPRSSRNPDLDSLSAGKSRLVILNKADLADDKQTSLWVDALTENGTVACAFNSKESSSLKSIRDMITTACAERIERDRKRGLVGRPVRAMIVGIPNVGKSTFINRLSGKKAAKTGNKPGVTRGKQWIAVDSKLQLLDTPGVLWPKFGDPETGRNLALIGSLNDENINLEELSLDLISILGRSYPGILEKRYGLDSTGAEKSDVSPEVLSQIASAKKLLRAGAVPDTERAASLILDEFRSGKLGRISLEGRN